MNTYFPKCIVTVHRRRWEKIDGTEMLVKIVSFFGLLQGDVNTLVWCLITEYSTIFSSSVS